MRKIALIFILVIYQASLAQSYELNGKDTINYVDETGKKQGHWIIFGRMKKTPGYEDDQKIEEGKYENSKKEGIWQKFFPNGGVKSKITFKANRPNGYAIIYHENGKISEEGVWKGNRWVGDYKLYYDNGQVAQEFNFNATGKREGPQKYYYENGQVMIEGNWAEGKEAGLLKEYYENGDVRSEKYFDGGKIDPAKTKTFEPKKPIVETKDEPAPTPKIVVKPEEKPNMPNQVFNGEGQWTLYNRNKQISKDGIFRKGRLIDGKVYHYTDDGILVRIAIYKEGKYVGDGVIDED